MKAPRAKLLQVETTQGHSASLHRESQFVLRYADPALERPELALSLTMPPRPEGYRGNTIPPVLAMKLLATRGTEALFDELVERYASGSAISGVQPKVVVPEARKAKATKATGSASSERSAPRVPDLIVKSAGVEYPGLAQNEFLCMSIARAVGLEVPEFWLSEDRLLFIVRRFDLGERGYLGFEDAASLTGRHPSRKYDAPYSEVARAIADFCAPRHRAASLEGFFRPGARSKMWRSIRTEIERAARDLTG